MVGVVVTALAATLVASPATAKKVARHKAATCQQVKEALAGGKSEAEAAKDLKVSEARVKACSTQTAKPAKKSHKAS